MESRYPFKNTPEAKNLRDFFNILFKKKKLKEIESLIPLLKKQNEERKDIFYHQLGDKGLSRYANLVVSDDPTVRISKDFFDSKLDQAGLNKIEALNRHLKDGLNFILEEASADLNDLGYLGISGSNIFANKLVNKDGEPEIFYHGVRKYNPQFRSDAMGNGVEIPFGKFDPSGFPATYFAKNIEYAMFYAGIAPNMPVPKMNIPTQEYKGFVYPVILKMFNPLDLRYLGFENTFNNLKNFVYLKTGVLLSVPMKGLDEYKEHPVWAYTRMLNEGIEQLKKAGVDGIIQIGDIPKFDENGTPLPDRKDWIQEEEYLTFYPNQIKAIPLKKARNEINDFSNAMATDLEDIRIYKKGGYVSIK
tara:strand:- start:3305 stop:4387 length:1083 start_codon:yes stop_codon:yes gene_type:complete